ncbi:hypothetical protein SDC9_191290 [bioreactor metagenome]|uniref:Uncharacterized protein n=1 Tax=bioreactor metagenome TaxID=1076179 RepID=A0A645HXY3_9ZZZZ
MEFQIDFRLVDPAGVQEPPESLSGQFLEERPQIIGIGFQQIRQIGEGDVFQIVTVDESPAVFEVEGFVVLFGVHGSGCGEKFDLAADEFRQKSGAFTKPALFFRRDLRRKDSVP